MRRGRLTLLSALLLYIPALIDTAVAAPAIAWEVANRFRLFRDEAQFRKLADVYDGLSAEDRRQRPAFAFEDAMQRAAAARILGPAFGDPASIDRYGWTSAVTRRTCFRAGNRGHTACKLDTGDEFLEPTVANIIVRLTEVPASFAGKTCRWTAGGRSVTQSCAQPARLEKIAFATPFDIAVTVEGSLVAEIKAQTIRHVTIVGFGDSFSSGEGNPDRPVELVDTVPSTYLNSSPLPGSLKSRAYPLRRDGSVSSLGPRSAAVWLSAQCHRSLYSQHVRAALMTALAHRNIAVSLMTYSCTGAETRTGILGYHAAREDVGEATYDASPQLMRFWRDFCRSTIGYSRFDDDGSPFDWRTDIKVCSARRAIRPDAALLSIGGNDIGFSNVIANELVATGQYGLRLNLLYKLWLGTLDAKTFAEARQSVTDLIPSRIRELSDAFAKHLDLPASAIVQTAYPQMTRSGGESTCPASTQSMDVHRILEITKQSTGREAATFVPFLNSRIGAAIAGLEPERRWRFVDSHVERFNGHALCNSGAPDDAPDRDVSGGLRFPNWLGFTRGQDRWEPFAPSAWRAYRPRNRWIVTPNDSFLSGHYMRVGDIDDFATTNPQDREQPLLAATLGGAFHPNASGHTVIADATIPVLREILKLPTP